MRDTKTVVKVTATVNMKLDGSEILKLLRHSGEEIPPNARVTFRVPGGGDWSNATLEVDAEMPITIEWEETHFE